MLERRSEPGTGATSGGTAVHEQQRSGLDETPSLHDAAALSVLDERYALGPVVGRGGMSTVFRAHDLVLERDVAVKVFPPVEDDDDLSRHTAETRVLAALNHANLVTLFDAGSVPATGGGRQAYLVMELVDGPTLAEQLVGGPLSTDEALVVGHQLAEALAVVHDGQVVHRDIKPGNVLLTSATCLEDLDRRVEPVVKLADFGIARLAGATRLTQTGVTVGTMRYLSPEQVTGGPLGPATDIYSLGLVLIECLTGVPAFGGTIAESAALRLTTGPAVPDVAGADVAALLTRMTATDPGDRPTAAQVAAATASALAQRAGRSQDAPADHALDRHVPDHPATVPYATPIDVGPSRRTTSTTPVRSVPADARPPARRWSRGWTGPWRRRPVVAAGGAVLLAAGALVVGLHVAGVDEQREPPSYPQVDGDLGDALSSLQRSVEP
ncbi:serine/threonine-protein kinase [Cellulomonas sp. URHB0016]